MKTLTVGDAQKLFGKDAIEVSSDFYKRFLIKADAHKDETYTTKDKFISKKLEIIQYKRDDGQPNDVYFALDGEMK